MNSFRQTEEGGLIIIGETESNVNNAADVLLIKLPSDITSIDKKPKTARTDYQ